MPKSITENEIQRLARIYRNALDDITRNMFKATDLERGVLVSVVGLILERLNDLDDQVGLWARTNIRELYRSTQKGVQQQLQSLGLDRDVSRAAATAYIDSNNGSIHSLLRDPQTGFLSSIWGATQEIRNRVNTIQRQVLALRSQQRMIDETIAKVGTLKDKNLNVVKAALLKELLSGKASNEMTLRPSLTVMGPRSLFWNLSNMPYITFPTVTGPRSMRIDKYVEIVARTKTSQASDIAIRTTLLKNGLSLVTFSRNRSMWRDACDLYVGRVFSLTARSAKENDVPHVDQLPSGGCPLHPNCTHTIQVWFPGSMSRGMESLAFTRPPAWALGSSWGSVQAEFKRRGGWAYAVQQNPMLKFAQPSAVPRPRKGKK